VKTGKSTLIDLIRDVMESEARSPLRVGRAHIEVAESDSYVELKPTKQDWAAPLGISIDSEALITCFPGKVGLSYEIFDKDKAGIVREVRILVKAVVNGEYRERINDVGGKRRIVAQWPDKSKILSAGLNVFRLPKNGAPGWRTISYQRYDS